MIKYKNILNRILVIFSIFSIIICISSAYFSNVKASSSKTITIDKTIYTLPDECTDNYCIAEVNDSIVLYFGDYPYWGVNISNNDVVIYNFKDSSHIGDFNYRSEFKQYWIKKGTTDFRQPTSTYNSVWAVFSAKYAGYEGTKCLYTSNDIKKFDGSIFFRPTLLGITETLVAETEKAQIMEQIKTMITGFLKYLIVLVISVIAFYKGWKFLSTQLRKS